MTVGAQQIKTKFALWLATRIKRPAVDAETGLLWKTKVEDHPLSRIGSPVLYRDRLYVRLIDQRQPTDTKYEYCIRSSLVALDTRTQEKFSGKFHCQEGPAVQRILPDAVFGPAGGAIWSAPTIDLKRKLIYVATGGSYTDVHGTFGCGPRV